MKFGILLKRLLQSPKSFRHRDENFSAFAPYVLLRYVLQDQTVMQVDVA